MNAIIIIYMKEILLSTNRNRYMIMNSTLCPCPIKRQREILQDKIEEKKRYIDV
jgi:hypothetical protein